ncbi:MAG: PucR family transcriptional regulator, partial [Thermocrispum sp.]
MTAHTGNTVLGVPGARVPAAGGGVPGRGPIRHGAPRTPGHGAAASSTQDILSSIPASLVAAVIRPVAGRMIREMIKEIRECVPAYAQPLEGEFGRILVTSVERAVLQIAEGIGKPRVDRKRWEEWFRHVGRVEFHEGRSMDSLQTAVRISTLVGWRHIRAAGVAIGIPTDTLFTFADALFQYGDELCSVAIAGYAEAQARASGTMERRRQRLLKLLLSGDPASAQSIADLAGVTDWALPEQVAVVALEYRDDQQQLPVSSLG